MDFDSRRSSSPWPGQSPRTWHGPCRTRRARSAETGRDSPAPRPAEKKTPVTVADPLVPSIMGMVLYFQFLGFGVDSLTRFDPCRIRILLWLPFQPSENRGRQAAANCKQYADLPRKVHLESWATRLHRVIDSEPLRLAGLGSLLLRAVLGTVCSPGHIFSMLRRAETPKKESRRF